MVSKRKEAEPAVNKRMENSVRNLASLYTVVIGVALTMAILTLIDPKVGLGSVTLMSASLFAALIVTMLPFYHGALRHLDDAYIENENTQIRDGALIFDFALLLIHGIAFVVLALLLFKPIDFAWVLIALLTVDIAWGIFVYFGSSTQSPYGAEGKWTIINLIFVVLAGGFFIYRNVYSKDLQNSEGLALGVAGVCLMRTVIDYALCRAFYFPRAK